LNFRSSAVISPTAGSIVDCRSIAVPDRTLPHQGQCIVDRLGESERGHLKLHAAGLDLREVKDVVDERQQMLAWSREYH
jgi:hypothetical protein